MTRFNFSSALIILTLVLCGCTVWAETYHYEMEPATTAQGTFDQPWDSAFNRILQIMQTQGAVRQVQLNPQQGLIRAVVQGTTVNIEMNRVSEKTFELSVRPEENLIPQVKVSESVYQRIHDDLQ